MVDVTLLAAARTSSTHIGFVSSHLNLSTCKPMPCPFSHYSLGHIQAKRRRRDCLFMVQSQDEEVDSTATQLIDQQQLQLLSKVIESDLQDEMKQKTKESETRDGEWTEELRLPVNPSTTKEGSHQKSNKQRMQMFAFLSQPIVEVGVVGLVLLSCFLVAINTLDDIPNELRQTIEVVDTLCVYVFAVEFFLRWWSAGQFKLRYLTRPLAAIDAIVVIFPLILSGLLPMYDLGAMAGFYPAPDLPGWLVSTSASSSSALLNLRLLRILKFQRVLTDEKTYMKFEMALGMKKSDVRPYQLQLARVIISIFTLASVSTGLIYAAEHEVNPNIPDYFTALYFGLTTLTTVGFGDITPVTPQGRSVVILSILAGVAIIPAQAASLAEAYLDFQKERAMGKKRPKKDDMKRNQLCSNCGNGPHRSDAFFCWNCGESLGD
jgi:voltage-gated potassium channel